MSRLAPTQTTPRACRGDSHPWQGAGESPQNVEFLAFEAAALAALPCTSCSPSLRAPCFLRGPW